MKHPNTKIHLNFDTCKHCGQGAVVIHKICENCSVDGEIRQRLLKYAKYIKEHYLAEQVKADPIYDENMGSLVGLIYVERDRYTVYHVPSDELLAAIRTGIDVDQLPGALREKHNEPGPEVNFK